MLGISYIIKNMIKFKTCPNIVITGLDKVLELFNVDPPPYCSVAVLCKSHCGGSKSGLLLGHTPSLFFPI